MSHSSFSIAEEIDAALDWWRAAGVDYDFHDDATAWLVERVGMHSGAVAESTEGAPNPSSVAPQGALQKTVAAPVDLLGESPPTTPEAFHEFWMTAPELDTIGPRGRVPPRGKAGAELMVLVIDPEAEDTGTLLSGPQGRLLSGILKATGYDDGDVYFASALPRHTPLADTQAAAQAGLAAVLDLHIKLINPQRIIAFGANISPLLENRVTNRETSLREINQNASLQNVLVSEGLDSLMAMPRLKARFWRRWMEWSAKQ